MRDTIAFLLGDQPRQLRGVDPTMTVLDYLRTVERRCGTKEGCNEGDCGACTVVLARPQGDRLAYRAVNACIQFVPMLDGCQLLTVEDLKARDGRLHPVQQAMVATHGSQCGFCTPGFVMSLFAVYVSEAGPVDDVDDRLAGNLCRCTGYGPIVAAAQRMYELAPREADRFRRAEANTARQLAELAPLEDVGWTHAGRRFFAPTTADALAALLLAHPDAVLVAGATDVGLWVTKGLRVLETVISVARVAELNRIEETEGSLEIGAAVTYDAALPSLAALYPDMGELIRRLGSVQIRNAGTVGGNVANGSPIGDMSPGLIAAGAEIVLRRGGERRRMLLERFFIAYGKQDRGPGEFVERIIVPKPADGARFRSYKLSKRFDQDISAVCGAFSLRLQAGRVAAFRAAYGGMAAVPKRAERVESAVLGRTWNEATAEAAMAALAEDFTPITDMRASAAYRLRAGQNMIMRLYFETARPQVDTRLAGDRSLAHV